MLSSIWEIFGRVHTHIMSSEADFVFDLFFFFPFLSTLVPFYIIVQSGTSFLQTPFSQLSPWKNSSFVFLSIVSLLLRRQPFVKARMNANVTPTFFFFIISQILRFTNSHMD